MKIVLVVGARPNFMKIAPIMKAICQYNTASSSERDYIEPVLVHTGQHYDYEMSLIFFQELALPKPDIYLGVGSGSHAEQTGKVMIELEKALLKRRPDLVLVAGDVNSTLGAALTATKLDIPVAHVEAGLRSYDRSMPEEINRVLTDAIAEYLLTPSPDATQNLRKEGIPEEKIFLVGNVMVDSLLHNRQKAGASNILSRLGLTQGGYAVITLHRPSNVDNIDSLTHILETLKMIAQQIPIVFPIHARTQKSIAHLKMSEPLHNRNITVINPLGYLDFLHLMMKAKFVMTDSGGIQEETTVLGIPCLTLRDNTERPITINQGTNLLVGNTPRKITSEAFKILNGQGKQGSCPELWDGKAAERIVGILATRLRGG